MALEDPVLEDPTPPDPPSEVNADGSSSSQVVTDNGTVIQTSTDSAGVTTTTTTTPAGETTTKVTNAAVTTTSTEPAVNPPAVGEPGSDQAGPPVSLAPAGVSGSPQAGPPAPTEPSSKPPFGASANIPSPAMASWGPAKDLRVKLRVPNEYMQSGSPGAGPGNILQQNGGILFPYTPTITMDNKAEYTAKSPLHSNYAQYFYKNSMVGPISITAKFTVQNEYEGAVLLGVIHLLRGLTKMKWGDDNGAGSPPPVCRLDAYGDAMLYNVPVSISSWRHDLPDNVDYITVGRPGSTNTYGHSLVPSLSTIQLTLNIMYSRQEQLAFGVDKWNSGSLKYKGYL